MIWQLSIASIVFFSVTTIIGIMLNDKLDANAGLISVLSLGWSIYTTGLVIAYLKNRNFYFAVNKLLLKVIRTHTFWNIDLDLELDQSRRQKDEMLLSQIVEVFNGEKYGKVALKFQSSSSLELLIENRLGLVIVLDDHGIHVHLDRELLVPTHLYEEEQKRLRTIAEDLVAIAHPTDIRCGMLIRFCDAKRNPYFGFFVNRIPADLLQEFHVRFRLNHESSCRIDALTDSVSVQSSSLGDLFNALTQVVSLRALPNEGIK